MKRVRIALAVILVWTALGNEDDQSLLQKQSASSLADVRVHQHEDLSKTCQVGDHVTCPTGEGRCAGEQCCSGTGQSYPCPSAPPGWGAGHCQSAEKVEDCLADDPTPSPSTPSPPSPTLAPTSLGPDPSTFSNCPRTTSMTSDSPWSVDKYTSNSCIGAIPSTDVARTCVSSSGQIDYSSIYLNLAEYDGQKKACFAWHAPACTFKVDTVSQVTFNFEFRNCQNVWACPLWMTPNPWCGPNNHCVQGLSGEIDFIEMCDGVSASSSYGCYNAPAAAQCSDGSWAEGGNAQNGPGGVKFFRASFDHETGDSKQEVCELDGSGCRTTATYTDYLTISFGGKYSEPYTFVSDIWNSQRVNGCAESATSFTDADTKCEYAITNIKVHTVDGSPYFSADKFPHQCEAFNA